MMYPKEHHFEPLTQKLQIKVLPKTDFMNSFSQIPPEGTLRIRLMKLSIFSLSSIESGPILKRLPRYGRSEANKHHLYPYLD